MTKKVLGRGLSALLSDADKLKDTGTDADVAGNFFEIPLANIEVNTYQPRTHFDDDALAELAESIKVQGIIQPITVRMVSAGKFQIISGERRYRASKLAGLATVPAYVRTADDQQMLEMALIENIQRENLNALEIALSYQRLITECSLKQEELGDRVGKNRTTVNNYLRLLKLPPMIQASIRDGELSMGHARALINVDDASIQLAIYKKITEDDLSVRQVEEMVRDLGKSKPKDEKSKSADKSLPFELKSIQTRLSSYFGTKVMLKTDKEDKGEIKIPYNSVDELNRILDLINPA